jgi:hypothetical protein
MIAVWNIGRCFKLFRGAYCFQNQGGCKKPKRQSTSTKLHAATSQRAHTRHPENLKSHNYCLFGESHETLKLEVPKLLGGPRWGGGRPTVWEHLPLRLRPTQPPVQWIPESFPGGKARPGRDAVHLSPSSAEVSKK